MQAIKSKINTYINEYLELWDFYGVIQVIKNDDILFENAYGYSNIEFGKLYFVRFSGNLHIEIYPIGEGRFVRRYFDQIEPYRIVEDEHGEMTFFGYVRNKSTK